MNPSFLLYHHYSDSSCKPDMIYIGTDKAKAFDALMEFGKKKYFDGNNIKIDFGDVTAVKAEENLSACPNCGRKPFGWIGSSFYGCFHAPWPSEWEAQLQTDPMVTFYDRKDTNSPVSIHSPEDVNKPSEISDNETSYRMALEHIREIWAASECGEPVHAQEAYAINLCKEMYQEAVDALAGRTMEPVSVDDILDKLPEHFADLSLAAMVETVLKIVGVQYA